MEIKPISGTWFEFKHPNLAEGKYWNPTCELFSEEQWREKLREIHETGMEYLPLLATALEGEAYFHTDIYPMSGMACQNPLEVILDEADKLDMKFFLGTGFYGPYNETQKNMTEPERLNRMLRAMDQLAEKYGHHKSFYGWYYPDEIWINGHFPELFINYVNLASAESHKLSPRFKTLIGPYGTRDVIPDDQYVRDLERIDVDIMAYQDEIGVRKTAVGESEAYYENLKKVHDKAGRSALWADVEIFEFEGQVYRSALLPAPFERVIKQLEAVSPYVEKILVYQYEGMMNKPGSKAFAGHPDGEKLYADYMAWKSSQK